MKHALPLLASCLLATGCDCTLEDEAFDLAGRGAVDCGLVPIGQSTADAFECAIDAYETSRPFVLQIAFQGKDSRVLRAYVGQADGDVFALHFDGDPSGGDNVGAKIDRAPCVSVSVVTVTNTQPATWARLVPGDRLLECREGERKTICD